jgi:hypothetical protein
MIRRRRPETDWGESAGVRILSSVRLILTLFALLGSGVAAAQASDAAERAFRADMEQRIVRAVPGIELRGTEPLSIEVVGTNLDGAVINFHRLYGYCQTASVADCEAEKGAFVEATASIARATPEKSAASLKIIVRDRQYVEGLENAHRQSPRGAEPMPYVIRPIGDDLFAILVFDAPTTIAIALQADFAPLNLTPDQAWTLALDQTFAILPRVRRGDDVDAINVVESREYGASMLLNTDMWEELSAFYGPTMAMTVVSDQFVLFGRIADGDAMTSFARAAAEDCAAAARCISPHVYRWRGGRWVRSR